jgi:hypothetical protein
MRFVEGDAPTVIVEYYCRARPLCGIHPDDHQRTRKLYPGYTLCTICLDGERLRHPLQLCGG